MRRRISGRLAGLCALALSAALLWAGTARTQTASEKEKAPLYTYVAEWEIPRPMWADYAKITAGDAEFMNKEVASGTVDSFGDYDVLNHQEGAPTHGSWYTAHSMANLLKVLEELRTRPDTTGPVFAAARHWDYILESRNYGAHAGTFKNGYLRVGTWKYREGMSDPNDRVVKATLVATLEKLMADGALHSYQIDEESLHSSDPGTFMIMAVTNGAEGLDKFNAAIDAAEKENPAAWAGLTALLDSEGHRDFLARVGSMTVK